MNPFEFFRSMAGVLGGLTFLPLLFLSSCVTSQEDIQYLNDRVTTLDQRVTKVEGSVQEKISSDVESRLEAFRTNQAAFGAEMDQLRGDLQDLTGRVEENSHLLKRVVEKDTTEEDTLKASVVDLSQRVEILEQMVKRLNDYLALKTPRLKKPPVPSGVPRQVEPRRAPVSPPPPKTKVKSLEANLYDSVLTTYREGKYQEAISGFRGFLNKYPKSELADNAQFWIGEAYMALGKYEQAILAYQEVIKKYPKGNKVANAMLRQAFAFYEIKDKTSSRLLLKKIIKKYPNSTEAKIAKTKLKTMK